MTELWLICLAVATPIASVVGFAVQIRMLRKARLESSKLELEIAKLRRELEVGQRRIVSATPKEVEKYSNTMFKRSGVNPGPNDHLASGVLLSLLSAILLYSAIAGVVLFLAYLCFDIYRVAAWIWSLI